MIPFLNPSLDRASLRETLHAGTRWIDIPGGRVPVYEDAIVLDDFLTNEARQHIEGQVYSSGTDLQKVYRTGRTGYGDNEINITEADAQIPLIGELRECIDDFLREVFPGELTVHALQLRELTPKSSGHSRHVDYEKGFDIHDAGGERYALTSLSLSLPISWNGGRAPVFIVEAQRANVNQTRPGSLGIFGPCLYHAHPPTTDFDQPYLWLVTQAFFKFPLGASTEDEDKLERLPVVVQSAKGRPEPGTLASWMRDVLGHGRGDDILGASEERIRRAYRELLSGYETDTRSLLNEVERVESYDGLVSERDIDFTSFCGHHFLPFSGTVDIAYQPGNIITGLGKLPRLVEAFSRRFQIQEFLVRDIALEIVRAIGARGVLVRAAATHTCMCGRGPRAAGTTTISVFGTGSLREYAIGSADRIF